MFQALLRGVGGDAVRRAASETLRNGVNAASECVSGACTSSLTTTAS